MAADMHIHIMTDNITEEHMKCFFSHTLGSDYFSWEGYKCEHELWRRRVYDEKVKLLHEKYPQCKNKTMIADKVGKDAVDYWLNLLQEWYKECGHSCVHHTDIENTPNIWIGEVSWLKAAIFEDADTFIPDTIDRIYEICSVEPVIDDALIESIRKALELPNATQYSISKSNDIIDFLSKYKGYKCFTISW